MSSTYPVSGSTLTSKISTGLSTQIIIKVNTEAVGAIQSIAPNQTRPIERIGEVGLDGVLELVPNKPTIYEASIERIVFDRLRLPEAFSRGFVNIKSQVISFDIDIIDRTNGDDDAAIVTTLKECWFTAYKPTYTSGDYIIKESASIIFRDIQTTQGTSSESAVNGGARGINFDRNERERSTDVGKYAGTMDVADLINQTFE